MSTNRSSFRIDKIIKFLVVIALMAGQLQNAAQAASWSIKILEQQKNGLKRVKVNDGKLNLKYNQEYVVRGAVPERVMKSTKAKSLYLEYTKIGDDQNSWRVVTPIKLNNQGKFRDSFRVSRELAKHSTGYNLRLRAEGDPGAVTPSGELDSVSQVLTATASGTITWHFTNQSGNDFNITWANSSVHPLTWPINNNTTNTIVYTNAPNGSGMGFTVQKQKCLGKCTTFYPRYDQAPSNTTACSKVNGGDGPLFENGLSYGIRVTKRVGLTDTWDGYVTGELQGSGTGTATCGFVIDSNFTHFWTDTSAGRWIEAILGAVTAVAILVVAWEDPGLDETITVEEKDLIDSAETLDRSTD